MSIRARLLLIAALATLVPALLLLARFVQDRSAAVAADTQRLAMIAQRTAEDLDNRIRGTAQLHYGLARAGDLATEDRAACSAFLSQVRAAYPQYTGILTIRPDGRLFCDSLQTGRELDLTNRDYFRRALVTREQVVLEPTFGRLTGLAVMQVAYPVRDAQGALRFVLLASLDLQKVASLDGLSVPGARLLIVDAKGVVLAAAPAAVPGMKPGEAIAGSPLFDFATAPGAAQTAPITLADGQDFHWARAAGPVLQQAQLHVLAGAPNTSLVAAADRRYAQDVALLAGMALALFASLGLLAELALRRPIARMQGLAQQLSAGELGARIAPPLPRGELGALMAALNQAAQSLQAQREDISQLNQRLLQSQRMEAIGQLTGGVAHDFNNLLTVVLGNAELLAEQSAGDPLREPLARMIVEAGQRGAALTQQLLAFARKQPLAPSAVDVNQLVAGMDALLRRTLGEHIEIELVRGAGLWTAMVDPAQLESALLNLCLNARDAMRGGGRLTLETANAAFDADYARQHPDLAAGQYVMLAVSDTGSGIPPELLSRVFEPFFTTKAKGKGTGLGLAMVYGFLKQSSGHVTIYSEPGHGTTVKLYLPRAHGGAPAADMPAGEPLQRGAAETVLVVEDDAAVRQLACRELRALGYQVLDADSGAAALVVLRSEQPIELLFTDVVMPGGMSGRELADAARTLRPGLRVLYTSGYTENAIVHHGRLDPGVQLLPKPYRRAELARAVRQALE
ncbi:ATP-binding protein [Piscinibacter defluvii]|uniref:ATP-binding protein n=1 Tax=Piscinibacter defluvii TaxID=1796922 RepID=UPI000FDD4BA9|nr:ATP-binding protein [Piscinibacter defluvii]